MFPQDESSSATYSSSMHRVPPQPRCLSSPCARVTSGCGPPVVNGQFLAVGCQWCRVRPYNCPGCKALADLSINWLQVLRHAETPQIDQGVGHQLHAIVPTLMVLEAQQHPLKFVLPRKRPLDALPSGMDRLVEPPRAPALGGLAVAWVLFDVRDHPRIEDRLAIRLSIKATIQVETRALELQTREFGDPLQGLQSLWKKNRIRCMHWCHREGSQHIPIVFD